MVYKISFFVSFFLLIWWFRVTVFLFLPRRFTLSFSLYSPYVWRRPHSDRIQSPFIPLFSYYIYWIMHQIELWFLVSLFFCQPAQVCSQSYLFLIPCFNLSNLRFYWIDYDIFYTHHFHLFNWDRLRCLQCMQLLPAIVWALFKFVVVKCLGIH